jgi:hypothetical protein
MRKDQAGHLFAFITLPFSIGATYNFCPLWFAMPFGFVFGLFWLGAFISLIYDDKP